MHDSFYQTLKATLYRGPSSADYREPLKSPIVLFPYPNKIELSFSTGGKVRQSSFMISFGPEDASTIIKAFALLLPR